MWFVNHLHENGIPVILDWVPAHFCKDEQGLYEFDGTCCYEYADPRKREHAGWGTRVFDYGRPEVRELPPLLRPVLAGRCTISTACGWTPWPPCCIWTTAGRHGQWTPNIHGGRENLEAVEFLRKLNAMAFAVDPNVLMIAEESTAWPLVTKPADDGRPGLQPEVEHGLDERHVPLSEAGPLVPAGSPPGS